MKFEDNRSVIESQFMNHKYENVLATLEELSGVWGSNPRSLREPELKSGALDRSAISTPETPEWVRTLTLFREPELKSGTLNRSAILTPEPRNTKNRSVSESQFKNQKYNIVLATIVRSGARTHALFREPELKSDALDRSVILTPEPRNTKKRACNVGTIVKSGVLTHDIFREPELKSGALDRSAILTPEPRNTSEIKGYFVIASNNHSFLIPLF
ncbi:hypothetical protein TNCV_960621 [Trichonephila clavipes]|nr:hypothetical protein TNCV_960621 [Trichonephila clavipes]